MGLRSNGEHGFDLFGIDVGAAVFADEFSLIDDHDVVAGIQDETENLFADDDGKIFQLADFAKAAGDVLDDRGLDAFGRLIEKEHAWIGEKRASDGELLLLTPGEVSAFAFAHFLKDREERVDFVHCGFADRSADSGDEVFVNVQIGEDHPALGDVSDALGDAFVGRLVGDFLVVERDGPGSGRNHADEGAEKRAFAHAVAADDAEDFSLRRGEAHVGNDDALAVANL